MKQKINKKLILPAFSLICSSLFGSAQASEKAVQLIEKAREVQKKAYVPYSHYPVGAAVMTQSGQIYEGCNVENASYGLTVCAERTAVFHAISKGEKQIEAIAIVTKDGAFSCGACRQVLNEFNPKMLVIAADEEGKVYREATLDQLLPFSYGPQNLKNP